MVVSRKGKAAVVAAEEPFYIPATASPSRPRYTLKHGDSFAVVDSHGDIGASTGGPDGVFHADTRYLSRFELLLNGLQPLLLGCNIRDDNSVLTVDLTNPDIYFDGNLVLPKDTIHLVRTLFLWQGCAYHRLDIRNHGEAPTKFSVSLAFDNDFADLFEVRGLHRNRRGKAETRLDPTRGAEIIYWGLDGQVRRTTLGFDPPPADLHRNVASYAFELESGERAAVCLTIECNDKLRHAPQKFGRSMIAAARERKSATRGAATVATSHAILNRMFCHSMADLYMLVTETPQGPYPYAGIPWYSTTFGRDGIITAILMLWCDAGIAKGVLKRLAAFQAEKNDPSRDAQPGKILHEMRAGEMAALREVPFGLYYGSVDSTPLFVLLLGLYVERTGDVATLRELWPNLQAALKWIDSYGDADGDGFVEYQSTAEHGLTNQGWKDSHDAICHRDGRLAEGPIALAEVQGYVYAAKMLAARCAGLVGNDILARELEAQAGRLRERFDAAFWSDDIDTYAIALDGMKEPCLVRTSNAGQVLFSGIARPERAAIIAEGLIHPRLFSGWGIRTMASDEVRYNPMSYHNGSIWPHDNALIALGLRNYRCRDGVDRVFSGMLQAASYMEFQRLPELFCGFHRRRSRGPTLYPVACSPQAWAAATPFALLQASLGLEFKPDAKEIILRNPHLPSFISDLTIKGLRLGESSVDLLLHGRADDVGIQVLHNKGDLRVTKIS